MGGGKPRTLPLFRKPLRDGYNGRPAGTGTPAAPLASLEQAVALAQEFTGQEPVVLQLAPAWQPAKMPVIQSVSADGFTQPLAPAVGFLVARSNVQFNGLKLVGNAHPGGATTTPSTAKKRRAGD